MTDQNFTSEEEAVLFRKLKEAQAEIDAERAKGADQREVEAIKAEMDKLAPTMQEHLRHPSRYQAELIADQTRMDQLAARLQRLGTEKPASAADAAGIRFDEHRRFYIGPDGTVRAE